MGFGFVPPNQFHECVSSDDALTKLHWQRSTHLLWEEASFREWAEIKMYKLWTVNFCFGALGTGYLGHNKAMSPLQPGHNNDTEIDLEYLNIKEEIIQGPPVPYEWP